MTSGILKFDGVNFNKDFWKTKSEAEFIAHESHHGFSEEQLKEAYAKIHPAGKATDMSLPGKDEPVKKKLSK